MLKIHKKAKTKRENNPFDTRNQLRDVDAIARPSFGQRRTPLALTLACLLVTTLMSPPAVSQAPPALTDLLHRIFAGREFDSAPFGPIAWVDDGEAYTVLEPAKPSGGRDIVRYSTATGAREVLVGAARLAPPGAAKPLEIQRYEWSKDQNYLLIFTNSKRVWRMNTRGDYWVLVRRTGELWQLGGQLPPSSLMYAALSPDSQQVAYVSGNNLYVQSLVSRKITQLTTDGSADIANGASDWLYEEEFFLRNAYRWSPDSKSIAYWQVNSQGVGQYSLLNDTEAELPVVMKFPYPQAGTSNPAARIGIVAAGTGTTTWVALPGDPHDYYIPYMEWKDSADVVIERLNRRQNSNVVWLADARSGTPRQVLEEKDPAWVDMVDPVKWIDSGARFLWLSERDGWRHVYAVSADGSKAQLLTPGDFDVERVLSQDSKWLYFMASPENPTERYLFRTPLDHPANPERLSPADAPGTHSYNISPNLKWAVHTYSRFDQPPIVDLVRLPDHHMGRVLSDNAALAAKVKTLVDPPAEFFRVDIGNGVLLDAWMIKPPDFDASKRYPILIHVYGEPAGQTVTDSWNRSTLFHRAIARQGYLVASFDNRGTASPRGRAWRKSIYGSLGPLSSEDQAAALRALAKSRPYVDLSRVAVWGWSGGGTNTLNLLFRYPDLYKVGMAVASVPDQRNYDTAYQERYMGTPQDNPEGYRKGSAINFAEGLKGDLLLVHGSGDDNVHFKGAEALVNRLIALGKPFEFMDYPNRTHALAEGEGTTLHVYSLLARYLFEHLPAGPR
jgi:dipeptidyl-peptidase-4